MPFRLEKGRGVRIGHLFDAINLDNLDPRRFNKQLVEIWRARRFGVTNAPWEGDAIGALFMDSGNFAELQSGWFDDLRITLPIDRLPNNRAGILKQLEWMIDSRRNPDVVKKMSAVFSRVLSPAGRMGSDLPRFELSFVATNLEDLMETDRNLAELLLSGRLGDACDVVCADGSNAGAKKRKMIRLMTIMWGLFDLQIIAYRIHHAEWNPLEAGLDNPENATLESVANVINEMYKMAKLAKDEFNDGKSIDSVDNKLRMFVDEHELMKHAARNAASLGIKQEKIDRGEFDVVDVAKYLDFLQNKLMPIIAGFEESRTRRSQNILEFIRGAGGTHKIRLQTQSKPERDRGSKCDA
uniref:hypothetical protein n=1 Tax=uncultured Sphingomonas sp. TaxID=158754 RepID=UPI0026394A1C